MLSGTPCAASAEVQGLSVYGGSIMTDDKMFGNDPAAKRRRMVTVTVSALCSLGYLLAGIIGFNFPLDRMIEK